MAQKIQVVYKTTFCRKAGLIFMTYLHSPHPFSPLIARSKVIWVFPMTSWLFHAFQGHSIIIFSMTSLFDGNFWQFLPPNRLTPQINSIESYIVGCTKKWVTICMIDNTAIIDSGAQGPKNRFGAKWRKNAMPFSNGILTYEVMLFQLIFVV